MNWIGLFAAMAAASIIFAMVSDMEITKCQTGSLSAMVHFCKPDKPPQKPSQFDCRFHPDGC
jgi:hypothetical protein